MAVPIQPKIGVGCLVAWFIAVSAFQVIHADEMCPYGWEQFGDKCFKAIIASKANVETAHSWCREYGGVLASIHSEEENQVVNEVARKAIPKDRSEFSSNIFFVYVGGTRDDFGNWRWEDGSPFDYTNWQENRPSADEANSRDANYLTINPQVGGKGWNNVPLMSAFKWYDAEPNLEYIQNSGEQPIGVCQLRTRCPRGWTLSGKKCYKAIISDKVNYQNAHTLCEKEGGVLASIRNSDENYVVNNVARKAIPKNRAEFSSNDFFVYVGGTRDYYGNWRWEDGSPFEYTNWQENRPSADDAKSKGTNYLTINPQVDGKSWDNVPLMLAFKWYDAEPNLEHIQDPGEQPIGVCQKHAGF